MDHPYIMRPSYLSWTTRKYDKEDLVLFVEYIKDKNPKELEEIVRQLECAFRDFEEHSFVCFPERTFFSRRTGQPKIAVMEYHGLEKSLQLPNITDYRKAFADMLPDVYEVDEYKRNWTDGEWAFIAASVPIPTKTKWPRWPVCLLACQDIEGVLPLKEIKELKEGGYDIKFIEDKPMKRLKEVIIGQLYRTIRNIHCRGIIHGNITEKNIVSWESGVYLKGFEHMRHSRCRKKKDLEDFKSIILKWYGHPAYTNGEYVTLPKNVNHILAEITYETQLPDRNGKRVRLMNGSYA